MKRFIQVVMVAAVLAIASTAEAAFLLRIEVLSGPGAGTGQIVGDGLAGDSNSGAGAITFIGAVGTNFLTNISTGLMRPATPQLGYIDLNSVNVASTGAGSLRLTLFSDGFNSATDPTGIVRLAVGGTMNAPAGSNVSFQGWAAPGTTNFVGAPTATVGALGAIGAFPAGTTPACSGGAVVGTPPSYNFNCFNAFTAVGAYSVFNQAIITFTGAGSVSFDLETQATVPEPGSMILLGTGLLGIAAIARRKLSKA